MYSVKTEWLINITVTTVARKFSQQTGSRMFELLQYPTNLTRFNLLIIIIIIIKLLNPILQILQHHHFFFILYTRIFLPLPPPILFNIPIPIAIVGLGWVLLGFIKLKQNPGFQDRKTTSRQNRWLGLMGLSSSNA